MSFRRMALLKALAKVSSLQYRCGNIIDRSADIARALYLPRNEQEYREDRAIEL